MAENQNNDNLERFFKANLEGYSPVPSQDFWARMEDAIPPKPAFWSGRANRLAKWAALGLLLLAVATMLLLWHNDRKQLDELSKTVAQQQMQLEQLGELNKQTSPAAEQESLANQPAPAEAAPQKLAAATPKAANERPVFTEGNKTGTSSKAASNITANAQNAVEKGNQGPSSLPSQTAENQAIATQIPPVASTVEAASSAKTENIASVASSEDFDRGFLPVPSHLGMVNSTVKLNTVRVPALKFRMIHPQVAYPRYSVEAGPTAFVMPVSRLFLSDTLYTGQTSLSYSMGLLLNYEISSSTSFQGGYQFKNIRSTRLALRYNSFPVSVRKRWAWSKKRYLEATTGLSVNSLVNARTDTDGQSVKGLKPTWLGLHGGLAVTMPLSDQLTLVAGPTAGFSLTPMAGSRRTWEVGVGAHLRYNLW